MKKPDSKEKETRRGIVRKTAVLGASTVIYPSFADVVSADTPSGNVELEITATIPTNTSIEVTVLEDTNGTGSASRQQSKSIQDGTNVYEYDLLQSSVAQGDELWLDISLSTSDDTITPELDSVTITLPEQEDDEGGDSDTGTGSATDPQDIGDIWDNFLVFVSMVVLGISAISLSSRSMAVASFPGYLVFAYIALETGNSLLTNILYITLVLIFIGMAFKMYRTEMGGEG